MIHMLPTPEAPRLSQLFSFFLFLEMFIICISDILQFYMKILNLTTFNRDRIGVSSLEPDDLR